MLLSMGPQRVLVVQQQQQFGLGDLSQVKAYSGSDNSCAVFARERDGMGERADL